MTTARVAAVLAAVALIGALIGASLLATGENTRRQEQPSSSAGDWFGKSPSDRGVTVGLIIERASGKSRQVTVWQRIGDGLGCRTDSVAVYGPSAKALEQDAAQSVEGSDCVAAVRYARFRGSIESVTIGTGSRARDTAVDAQKRAIGAWWTADAEPVFNSTGAGPTPVVVDSLLPGFDGSVQTGWLSPAASSDHDLLFDCAVGYAPACVADQIGAAAHDDLSK